MRRLVTAGLSDIGRVRTSNEDAYLVADSVFAVADGMGGHVAGEVAASAALEPIRALDGRVFPDGGAALDALRAAVVEANVAVTSMAADEPSYRGMGTTLTAVLLEGRRLHIAHVGDSRAYLLRDGQFSQITDDHTLVQHLVDEGQITPDEAVNHPQRSIITRAIGVSDDVEPDSMTLEMQPDDVLLLCSDGLTGVVDDTTIADELASGDDLAQILSRLVEKANEAGGPDNVTAVLLRDEDPDAPRPRRPQTVTIRTRDPGDDRDWASTLGAIGSLRRGSGLEAPRTSEDAPGHGRSAARWTAIVFGIALLLVAGWLGGRFLLSQIYFVALDGDEVTIFQGIDAEVGPVDLARVREHTGLMLDDVPVWYHPTLEAGRPAADINDARRIVADIPRRDADDGP
ncbi:MAG: Stp1/IreP family PP2C-type Ser/Thr phosphatase [Nitriliruptoraceae bacterium]